MMANLITGLFDTESGAESAVAQLKSRGYTQNEISIIMKDQGAAKEFVAETGSKTMESVGTGAAIGGTIGAVLAGLLAVGSITIPGVGLIAAGSIAALLAGAGAGGIAGSLLGWLIGAGIPEDVAPYYERGLGEGGVVVAVASHPGDEAAVRQILAGGAVAYGGYNTPSYVSPSYASRYTDLNPPPKTYDTANNTAYSTATTANEANRTANSLGAEARSAERTQAEHEREERRDVNPGIGTAFQNEADRIKTGLKNQEDKVSTGMENTTDRIKNP
ncbi:MAG TPA: hypothetical protein VKU00_34715 [Chthonomonadaceae bacterium]|nr:hypothetical protein [Chthonomonadaceae bacterium]